MFVEKPTPEQLQERHRQQEASRRAIALRIPLVVNANPSITIGELAEQLDVRLGEVCHVLVSRINRETTPTKLRHPEGRGVAYDGTVTDEFGNYTQP